MEPLAETWVKSLVAVAVISVVGIGLAVPDIVNCQVDLGSSCTQYDMNFNCISYSHSYVAGKTTIREYLFGGDCRGLALGTSVSSPISGVL